MEEEKTVSCWEGLFAKLLYEMAGISHEAFRGRVFWSVELVTGQTLLRFLL